jgi:phage-related baseplate assembly protein
MIGAVRDYLYRDDIKPLTDVVVVRSVTNFTYRIKADVYIAPGPDPIMVRDQVLQSLQAMAAGRRTPARDVPRSAIYAAAQIGPVDKVVLHEPTVDIARDYGEVGICTGIEIKVMTYAG